MRIRALGWAAVIAVSPAVHVTGAHAEPVDAAPSAAPIADPDPSRPTIGTAAFEAGALVGPHRGDDYDVAVHLGLTAVGLAPLSRRWSVGAGVSILPVRGVFGVSIPARVEFAPVQDWRPGATTGSLTLVLRAGVRAELVRPMVFCLEPHDPGHCPRGSGFGALGELGFALRGAPGQIAGGDGTTRFELGFSFLAGPMQGWGSAPSSARGLYAGGSMTLGVAF